MSETKQQVFNAAVEKAVAMTLLAGIKRPYSDKYRKDMQKRYAAASDGDPKCPYCHGTPEEPEDTRAFQENEDGQIGADVNHVCWVNLYGHIPTLEIECDYATYETTPIHFCPQCGRDLRGDSNE